MPRIRYRAPEIAHENGTFFLYYAMGGKEEETFALRVATSRTPDGPYADNGTPLIDCERNRFTIDAHPFRDADGQWYMFYARNFLDTEGGVFPGTAVVVDRLVNMTKLAGGCGTVVRARHPWTLYEARRRMNVYNRTFDEWHTIEGAFVRRYDGRYYCFYSGSNYQTASYGVDYVVADHVMDCTWARKRGPRAERRARKGARAWTPLACRRARRHVGGRVYHAWDADMKVRQLCIDPLAWTRDGPRCLGPTTTPQPRPAVRATPPA